MRSGLLGWALGLVGVMEVRAADDASLALAYEASAVGRYAEAAEQLELYAMKMPKEPAAPAALADAMALRVGLEQTAQARADWNRWLKLYAARAPEQAAAMHMVGWSLAGDDGERLRFVEVYLKQHAAHGGVDRRVIALVEAGRLLWQRSCTRRGDGPAGLCVSEWSGSRVDGAVRTVKRGKQAVCTERLAWAFTVHARDARLAAAAQGYFAQALKVGVVAVEDPSRVRALREALATARLLQTDQALETLMALQIPQAMAMGAPSPPVARDEAMVVTPRAPKKPRGIPVIRVASDASAARQREAMRRFSEFFQAMRVQGAAVEQGYAAVIELRDPRQATAAMERVAAVQRTMVSLLLGLPVPRGLDEPRDQGAYCDLLVERVTPWVEQQRAALTACVDRSIVSGEFGPAFAGCEAALVRGDPRGFVPLTEIVPAPGGPTMPWEPDVEGVWLEAPTGE